MEFGVWKNRLTSGGCWRAVNDEQHWKESGAVGWTVVQHLGVFLDWFTEEHVEMLTGVVNSRDLWVFASFQRVFFDWRELLNTEATTGIKMYQLHVSWKVGKIFSYQKNVLHFHTCVLNTWFWLVNTLDLEQEANLRLAWHINEVYHTIISFLFVKVQVRKYRQQKQQ